MNEVRNYLSNKDINAPFFLVVGDGNYASVKEKLIEFGLKPVPVSDYCSLPDKPPSLDKLLSTFAFADIDGNSRDKKIFVLGLGEYLALRGERETRKWLSGIKDEKTGTARVVLLLRGVTGFVRELQAGDKSRFDNRRVLFTEDTDSSINIVFVPPDMDLPAANGQQGLLAELESGKTTVYVKSNATFDNPLFSVGRIKSAYDGVKKILQSFPVEESFGTTEQWARFLSGMIACNGVIDSLFDDFGDIPENSFNQWINGNAYKNWLYFIALKYKAAGINNSYLKYVVEMTTAFSDFKRNILNAIIDIKHTDGRFDKFYAERKALVERLYDSDVAGFVADNKRDIAECPYKLTDQTLFERKAFVALFSHLDRRTLQARAETAYPALSDYLWKYTFADEKAGAELNLLFTDYFDRYKWQKILNRIEDGFIAQVEDLAVRRVYNGLRTRREVIASLDKSDTLLYWIDALGIEFLGFIQKLCALKELSLNIHIAQADLPTITSENDGFYKDWPGKKHKVTHLDEIKHKVSGGYIFTETGEGNLPIHLAEELDVIAEAIEAAATELKSPHCSKVLIVSDHGASRLSVINRQEEKYEVDAESKGKHGGRCCKKPAGYSPTAYDLPFATEGNDFIVLANYGRFKGSRAANIEVHGGAALEEVVVPVIEITLANPDTAVELLDGDGIFASFRKPLVFMLFSKTELQNVRVVIDGMSAPYKAEKKGLYHHHFATDIKRPGEYRADVFAGDNHIGEIMLNVQSETQKKGGDDFDNLF